MLDKQLDVGEVLYAFMLKMVKYMVIINFILANHSSIASV